MIGNNFLRSWEDILPESNNFTQQTGKQSHHYSSSNRIASTTPSSSSDSMGSWRYPTKVAKCEQDKREALIRIRDRHSSTPFKNTTPMKSGVYYQKLIKEITMLELDIKNLEQHLLELYQQAFNQKSASSPSLWPLPTGSELIKEASSPQSNHPYFVEWQGSPPGNSSWRRLANETSSKKHFSYSQPNSFRQGTFYKHNHRKSLASKNPRAQVNSLMTAYDANRLSEDIVLCMAAIYHRIAEPQVPQNKAEVSPSSSFSTSTFAAQGCSSNSMWASQHSEESSYAGSYNDFEWKHVIGQHEEVDATFEVKSICVDDERLTYTATMLHTFQSLVQQLESIDPGKLGHQQKLAFWINIHNALVMHAYLAYGIPQSQSKRVALLQKAAYRVGAHFVNAQLIKRHILRCKSYRPAKWLHSVISPGSMKKNKLRGADGEAYALQHPEPLLYFALSCGARSDPAVRIYTPKLIYRELEAAKHDFLSAHVSFHVEGKVSLPKILKSFARDTAMTPCDLLKWVANSVENSVASFTFQCNIATMANKAYKRIQWMHYELTFHYVFVIPFARSDSI
ncbi:hypothetical protein L7F22_020853 [Adiantum nelumboides]|nr:hypothetical protein [Adiantum nelumboides]